MKIIRFLDKKGEEVFLVSIIAFSVLLLFIQVVMRYVFKNSISWSEELARYAFLWMIWVGASLATKEVKHLKAEFMKNMLSDKKAKILTVVSLVLWLGFSLWLAYSSFWLTVDIFQSGQKSAAMQLPMFIPYASVPVGTTLMSLRLIQHLCSILKKKGKEA